MINCTFGMYVTVRNRTMAQYLRHKSCFVLVQTPIFRINPRSILHCTLLPTVETPPSSR